jgi:CDP-glucose 4,6-dehydratase
MRVLITGHTGFKGAWLTRMLTLQGHAVSGFALDPEPGALFTTARLSALLEHDVRADIRDAAAVQQALQAIAPDAVIHMAAQPLVRASYADPRGTVETNVIGTMNLLEAVGAQPSVKAHVVVTTDKVYRNVHQVDGYVEDDALGGHDPYSASKAMADILTQSWIASFDSPPTAIARAGNVIGGGDVCRDRLMPDLLGAFARDEPAVIRYPDAVRPWQHVLDCLNGYVALLEALLAGRGAGETWNFGPGPGSFKTVAELADLAASLWGPGARWEQDGGEHPHEAALLALDAAKARVDLGWDDRLDYSQAVAWTVAWQKSVDAGEDPRSAMDAQLAEFASAHA